MTEVDFTQIAFIKLFSVNIDIAVNNIYGLPAYGYDTLHPELAVAGELSIRLENNDIPLLGSVEKSGKDVSFSVIQIRNHGRPVNIPDAENKGKDKERCRHGKDDRVHYLKKLGGKLFLVIFFFREKQRLRLEFFPQSDFRRFLLLRDVSLFRGSCPAGNIFRVSGGCRCGKSIISGLIRRSPRYILDFFFVFHTFRFPCGKKLLSSYKTNAVLALLFRTIPQVRCPWASIIRNMQ